MNTRYGTILALLALPIIGQAADAAGGHTDYDAHCKSCHGATGAANAAVAKMMKVDIKDLGSSDVQSQSDADLIKVINEGRGKMKPVKLEGASSAANVAAYLRTFRK